jgi:hypothetical protein
VAWDKLLGVDLARKKNLPVHSSAEGGTGATGGTVRKIHLHPATMMAALQLI